MEDPMAHQHTRAVSNIDVLNQTNAQSCSLRVKRRQTVTRCIDVVPISREETQREETASKNQHNEDVRHVNSFVTTR